MSFANNVGAGLRIAVRDMARGFFELVHNSFALVGLVVAICLVVVTSRPDLRDTGEKRLGAWLQARHQVTVGMDVEPDAIDRSTATNPRDLPKQHAAVAFWLAQKYRVAPEPMAALVAEAHDLGQATKLDPHLILAIAAIESGFNPFAQSPVGAQGLMQVMTNIHADKYSHFGGKLAAFDPVTNLRVGVKVLQECIQRAGSLDAGLKFYVGAALHDTDGGYAAKVYAEQARLRDVAAGRQVPLMAPQPQFVVNNGANSNGNGISAAEINAAAARAEFQSVSTAAETTKSEPSGDPVTLNKM